MNRVKDYILISAVAVLCACSPAGYDPTQVELSDLVGLWDSSENKDAKMDVI